MRDVGEKAVARVRGGGDRGMGPCGDLQDGPGGDDDVALAIDALPNQGQDLLMRRRDALAAVGLDAADAVGHEGQQHNSCKHQEACADAQRRPALTGLAGRRVLTFAHTASPPPNPTYIHVNRLKCRPNNG